MGSGKAKEEHRERSADVRADLSNVDCNMQRLEEQKVKIMEEWTENVDRLAWKLEGP